MIVKFLPFDKDVELAPGDTVLQAATRNGFEIKSLCKGNMTCAECRVRVVKGEENILPPSRQETQLIGTGYHIDGRRLACQIYCFGDVTVDLQEQVDRADTQSKKVRGFRSQKHVESKAVVDTMILNADDPALRAGAEAEGAPAVPGKGSGSGSATESQPKARSNSGSSSSNRRRRHSKGPSQK